MKIIKFVYENPDDLEKFKAIIDKKKLNVEIINESDLKEKRKAILLKSKFGAKLNPFIGVFDDTNPIKGFYRESCDVLYHFNQYLNHPKKVDKDLFREFIAKCKFFDLTIDEVIDKLKTDFYA